jgi:hypothetical protein
MEHGPWNMDHGTWSRMGGRSAPALIFPHNNIAIIFHSNNVTIIFHHDMPS